MLSTIRFRCARPPGRTAATRLGPALLLLAVAACAGGPPVQSRYEWTALSDAAAADGPSESGSGSLPADVPSVEPDTELAGWLDGPEGIIATEQEKALFAALSTADARRAFVEEFWRRRDRSPADGVNESRQEFERRLAAANAAFGNESTEGWRTGFGMTLLVVGFPYSVTLRRDGFAETRPAAIVAPAESRSGDQVSWRYGPDDLTVDATTTTVTYWSSLDFFFIANEWRLDCGEPRAWSGALVVGGTVTGIAPTTPRSSVGSSSPSSTDDMGAGSLGIAPSSGGIRDGSAPRVTRWWAALAVPRLGRFGRGGRLTSPCGQLWAYALERFLPLH
jgi:GWxTD domain-containing protein